jgi:hypothetical protein
MVLITNEAEGYRVLALIGVLSCWAGGEGDGNA